MDFKLDETQEELRALASDVLAKEASHERLESHEKSGRPYDERLWKALREAGLTAVCAAEHAGGAGLGPVELAVVLREAGARAAPGPLAATLVSTLAVSRYGSREHQRRVAGTAVSTVAIREPGRALTAPPTTVAEPVAGGSGPVAAEPVAGAGGSGPVAGGWLLSGRKSGVAHAEGDVLVTADQGLFLVHAPPAAPEFASTGEPTATITLDRTPAERVAGPEAIEGVRQLYTAAAVAQASGVLAGALRLTTEYIRTRKQFGRALAEFQAVTMQIADVYIAGRALDVAMWSGAWRLAEGLPAEEDLAIAAFHTSEAVKALYTCQHLHGGLGLDVTYPLHRYFAHAMHLAHRLGSGDVQLDLIGGLA
ncbi:acyl-CoA dehydrogenase family protein [Nonomuraea sp. NPDC049714]|uniref:acyl-CoA dehydrogenase family protein n=1 Tax=Nonomuraea sp. NPDC049714 TaxID=3364357 RepID=UPI00379036A0